MLYTGAIGVLLLLGIAVSSVVPSDETLRLAFDRGQRFYVIEDYTQAIEKFQIVKDLEDSRLVDESEILIRVGEVDFPVRVAATFQLANAHRNLAVERLTEAESERDPDRVVQLQKQASEGFVRAAQYYHEAAASTDLLEIQVLSQYQLVKTCFQAKDYPGVIEAGRILRERYPTSDYVDEALYEVGWAHYGLQQYEKAIESFSRVTGLGAADYRVDRAQFQIGKSHFELKRYPECRKALRELLDRYDTASLGETQLARMEADKLSGVVKETALELVAKAELLTGDCHAAEGDVGAAVAAYQRVVANYSRERELVEDAYVKIGQAHFDRGDLEAGMQLYRRAIAEVPDPGFRARMQARIARQYYDSANYAQALSEYGLLIKGYGDVRQAGVLSLDRASFQRAQCLFELAEEQRRAGDQERMKDYFNQAQETYLQVMADYPGTSLRGECLLGAGLTAQRRGEEADRARALELFTQVRDQFPAESDVAARARLQIARFHYVEKDFPRAAELYADYLTRCPESVDRDQVLLELGLARRDAEQLEEALAALVQVPAESPLGSKACLVGGELLLRLGRLDEAVSTVRRGLAPLPEGEAAGELNYVLAKVYFEQRKYSEALACFALARRECRTEVVLQGALLGTGSTYYQTGEYAHAARDLEALLAAEPPESLKDQAHRLLGQIYVKMGRREEAIEAYQAVIATSEDPRERVEFTLLLAELYYGLGRYEEAIAQTQAAIDARLEDRKPEEGDPLKDRAYFVLGNAYVRMENPVEAQRVFSKALELSPRSTLRLDLLYGKAASAFALERYDEVVPLLQEFVSRSPDSPNLESAHYFLAYAYLRQEEIAQAVVWFGRLADRFPASTVAAEALFQQGEGFFNLSRFGDAAASYKKVLDGHPDSEFVDNAMYNLAWCHFELAQPEEAVAQFSTLVARYPGSPFAVSAQFSLGDHYFNKGEYEAARVAYQGIVDAYPNSEVIPQAKRVLAEIKEIQAYPKYEEAMALFDKEEYSEAATALAKVIADYPGTEVWTGAMANLGMCYEYQNRWKEAAKIYQELLQNYDEREIEFNSVATFAKEHLDWLNTYRL